MKTKLIFLINWLSLALTNIGRFVVGMLLLAIGLFLLPPVIVAATIFYFSTIWSKNQTAGEILVNNGTFNKNVSIGIDILGNIIGGNFFNWLLLKEVSTFPFGVPGEKMSSVLQWNFIIDNLSEWGANLKYDLDTIEFEHCEKSLTKDLYDARYKIDCYKALISKAETIENTKAFMAKYN